MPKAKKVGEPGWGTIDNNAPAPKQEHRRKPDWYTKFPDHPNRIDADKPVTKE